MTKIKEPEKKPQAAPPQAAPPPQQIVKVIENRGALVTSNIPDYLRHEGPKLGTEYLRSKDISLARFQLAQETTKSAKKQNTGTYLEGLEPGMFYNTLTKQIFGEEVFVIFLLERPKRARMPEVYTGSGGPLCTSEDGIVGEGDPGGNCRKCIFSRWRDNNKVPPLCSEVMAFHLFPLPDRGYIPTPDDWCIWGAKKTAIDAGKMANRLYTMRGEVDLFGCVFKFGRFWDTSLPNPCWVPTVGNAGWATPEQLAVSREFFYAVSNLERAGSIRTRSIVDDDDEFIEAEVLEPGASDAANE